MPSGWDYRIRRIDFRQLSTWIIRNALVFERFRLICMQAMTPFLRSEAHGSPPVQKRHHFPLKVFSWFGGFLSKSESVTFIIFRVKSKLYEDEDVTDLPTHKKVDKGLALVPEGKHLFPNMTVYENLAMGAYVKRALKYKDESIHLVYSLNQLEHSFVNLILGLL